MSNGYLILSHPGNR